MIILDNPHCDNIENIVTNGISKNLFIKAQLYRQSIVCNSFPKETFIQAVCEKGENETHDFNYYSLTLILTEFFYLHAVKIVIRRWNYLLFDVINNIWNLIVVLRTLKCLKGKIVRNSDPFSASSQIVSSTVTKTWKKLPGRPPQIESLPLITRFGVQAYTEDLSSLLCNDGRFI